MWTAKGLQSAYAVFESHVHGAYTVTDFQPFKSKCNILTTIVTIIMIVIFFGWIKSILITIIANK